MTGWRPGPGPGPAEGGYRDGYRQGFQVGCREDCGLRFDVQDWPDLPKAGNSYYYRRRFRQGFADGLTDAKEAQV